jgi:hypothetical protein
MYEGVQGFKKMVLAFNMRRHISCDNNLVNFIVDFY